MTKETRKFRMHPDLLFSVIKSQAGSAQKALLEAVMNAVDAGATRCDVTLDEKGYVITDDGKGFVDRKEIDEFFETFGTPHKEGDATYGRFRMGRGQLFSFSRTIWNSNTFQMDVCIKTKGLDYEFSETKKSFKGCKITGTWYEPLKGSEIVSLTREFKLLIKYMQIPVFFNGEEISCQAAKEKWDTETDEAYIKTSQQSGVLSVYNLGALVSHYPASQFGTGGIVVSKQQLTVNFARNDVLVTQCKVWKKISQKLNDMLGIETQKKTVLNDSERIALANRLAEGSIYLCDVASKGIFLDASGRKPNFKSIMSAKRISMAGENNSHRHIESKITEQGLALVLDRSMLDRFMVNDIHEFMEKMNNLIKLNNKAVENERLSQQHLHYTQRKYTLTHIHIYTTPQIIDIEELKKSFDKAPIVKKVTTKRDKAIVKAIKEAAVRIEWAINSYNARGKAYGERKNITPREIQVGISQTANAWTDGRTYICFEERVLKSVNAQQIVNILLHEYCHTQETMETHQHGIEFFEMFHDIQSYHSDGIYEAVRIFQKTLVREFVKAGISPANKLEENIETSDKFDELVV